MRVEEEGGCCVNMPVRLRLCSGDRVRVEEEGGCCVNMPVRLKSCPREGWAM